MRKLSLILLFLALGCTGLEAQTGVNANLTAADAGTCATANACLVLRIPQNVGGATFTITTNASANTVQFEASGDNQATWVALNVTPSNSTTAVTSTTSTGTWQANVAGYTHARMRISTFVAGSTASSINPSTASARAGGGGGLPAGCTSPGTGAITCTGTVAANALTSTTSLSTGSGASAVGPTATGGIGCVEATNTGYTPTAGQAYIRCDTTLNNYAVSIPLNGATETPLPVFNAVPAGGKCAQTSGVAGLLAETSNPCGTATVLATGTNPPVCAVATSAWCGGGSVPPTPVADVYDLHPDSTQKAFEVNNNNTGEMPVSRVSCLNVTPVTINTSTTADQNLMACTLSANLLNVVGRILKIYGAGVYSTAATSTAQLAMEAKLCTVSGCGSGTVVDICDITTIALASVTVTNNTWAFECIPITQTAGASSVYEHSGRYTIDLGSLTSAADSVFLDPTATAVSSAIDSTAQLFLQISGAFSAASASNTMTERQLFVEVLN